MNHKYAFALAGMLVSSAALAATQPVSIGGKTYNLDAVTVGGKSYVNYDQLKVLLGATGGGNSGGNTSGAGGANQKASVEGCMNEWLFNGIWRMRVTKAEVVTNPSRGNIPGYAITVEINNGTKDTLTLGSAGIDAGQAVSVVLQDGNQVGYSYGTDYVDVVFRKLMQGTGLKFTYRMWPEPYPTLAEAQANKPVKFLMEVKTKINADTKAKFTVPDPSFRVNLTCSK